MQQKPSIEDWSITSYEDWSIEDWIIHDDPWPDRQPIRAL